MKKIICLLLLVTNASLFAQKTLVTINGEKMQFYQGGNISYSLVEQPTGDNWIDGKPIFVRTFTARTPNNTTDTVLFTVANAIKIVNYIAYGMQNITENRITNLESFTIPIHGQCFQFYGSEYHCYWGSSMPDVRYQDMPITVTVYYTK